MKKKNILIIIFFIILILAITLLFSFLIFNSNKDMQSVLLKDNYIIKRTNKKGDKIDEYTYKGDSTFYKKDDINIFISEYDNFKMARDSVLENYEQEKKTGTILSLVEEENFVRKELCHANDICSISIASGTKFIRALFKKEKTAEAKEDIENILKVN